MSTCSVSQSDVDIDTYFDTLDFDVYDLDITANLIKSGSSEGKFQLPVPTYQATSSDIKEPLDHLALKQAAYEISLLARQLENSPFSFVEPFENRYGVSNSPGVSTPQRSKCSLPYRLVIGLGLLLSALPAYVHYSHCSTTTLCLHQAKSQLIGALNSVKPFSGWDNRPQTTGMSSNTISRLPTPASDPFREGVNQAMRAAELTQTATQAAEWETVANGWLEAIRLMNLTPATHPRYGTAAVKVEEYARNLAYAQRRMREATSLVEPQDAASGKPTN